MEEQSGIIWLNEVDSTNDEDRRRLSGLDNLSVVAAVRQTAGRGQGDHTWTSEPVTWYCWRDAEGVPMLTVGIVNGMAHANYPEESWLSWDEYLCQFSKDEQGRLLYRGRIVRSALRG